MRKQLIRYRKSIDKLLESDYEGVNWDDVIQEHLVQISFFQYERQIHLLVTLAFAIMEIAAAVAVVLAPPIAHHGADAAAPGVAGALYRSLLLSGKRNPEALRAV